MSWTPASISADILRFFICPTLLKGPVLRISGRLWIHTFNLHDRFCLGSNPKHQCPRISWDRIPSTSVLGRCYSQCTETLKCFLHLRRLFLIEKCMAQKQHKNMACWRFSFISKMIFPFKAPFFWDFPAGHGKFTWPEAPGFSTATTQSHQQTWLGWFL